MATLAQNTNGTTTSCVETSTEPQKRKSAKSFNYESIAESVTSLPDAKLLISAPVERKDGKMSNWTVRLQLQRRSVVIGFPIPVSLPFGISAPLKSSNKRVPKRVAIRLEESEATIIETFYDTIYKALVDANYPMNEAQPQTYKMISRGADDSFPPLLNASLFDGVKVSETMKWGIGIRFFVSVKADNLWYLNATVAFVAQDMQDIDLDVPIYITGAKNEENVDDTDRDAKKAKLS